MRVRWLRKARLNLDSIHAYIARDNPHAASRVIRQIVDRVDDLAANPNSDTRSPGRVAGTRELVIAPSCVIPFRIKGGALQVLRVFHTRQRWPDKLP